MTILDKIVEDKKVELQSFPEKVTIVTNRSLLSFTDRLAKTDSLALISEVKRASPSAGNINVDIDPVTQAQLYEQGGADAISVLTDEKHFKGTLNDLEAVRQAVNIPILNKNFIIDERQIYQAYNAGADIILLIVAILNDEQLEKFYKIATDLGMDVIVEVHDEQEMPRALNIDPNIIGINNRNLKEFTVDIAHTEDLLNKYGDKDKYFISESGVKTSADAKRMLEAGAKGLLVGETLMRSADASQTIEQLKQKSI